MKFMGERHDIFDDEIIFWVDITDVPAEIQNQAKQIDGENYSPDCFGMCVCYDRIEKKIELSADEQGTNIYYVDNDGENRWYCADISDVFLNEIFTECKKRIQEEIIASYEIMPFEPNETHLFFRLDGEKSERHGLIGYMRADFGRSGNDGFFNTWLDNQKHLKTPAFKAEFQKVIDYLRKGMQYPVFSNRYDLEAFCLKHPEQRINDRGIGFKIQTADYSFYARCRPTAHDYDIYVMAYDNRYLLPELAGQHELPNDCYSILPSSGEIVFLVNGEKGYFPYDKSTPDPELNRQFVAASNALLGVTRAQEEAMLAGSLFGWDTPAAKPWNYDKDGSPRQLPPSKKREEHER